MNMNAKCGSTRSRWVGEGATCRGSRGGQAWERVGQCDGCEPHSSLLCPCVPLGRKLGSVEDFGSASATSLLSTNTFPLHLSLATTAATSALRFAVMSHNHCLSTHAGCGELPAQHSEPLGAGKLFHVTLAFMSPFFPSADPLSCRPTFSRPYTTGCGELPT